MRLNILAVGSVCTNMITIRTSGILLLVWFLSANCSHFNHYLRYLYLVDLKNNQYIFFKVESKSGRILYGRLKRAPKLPSKPALQSSESSTDDLSGSEDSSSDDIGLDFVFLNFLSILSDFVSREKRLESKAEQL